MLDHTIFLTERRLARIKEALNKRQPDISLVLENINDPHNLSACLRSCDATGVMDVCLVYYGSQPIPKLSRTSSASAIKWVDTRLFNSVEECYSALRAEGKRIFTTHLSKDSQSLYTLNLHEPCALVFGNEHAGVSETAFTLADGNFNIPQTGMTQSLNISVACAVTLYEAYRQRLSRGLFDEPRIPNDKFNELVKEWAAKS